MTSAAKHSDDKTISALWERSEDQRAQNVEKASAILKDPRKYGGHAATLLVWARLTIKNDVERRKAAR